MIKSQISAMGSASRRLIHSYTRPGAAPLQKSTHQFAHHQIPLHCDVYQAEDYPSESPVFVFFHSGGLVCGHRSSVPPWLVQVCHWKQWPLVSASYRLLPRNSGKDFVEDAAAAVEFSTKIGGLAKRQVIVGGASAGGFLATLAAHHIKPSPLALFLICAIPTFNHSFFRSSLRVDKLAISQAQVEQLRAGPPTVGTLSWRPSFDPQMLLPDGSRNQNTERPRPMVDETQIPPEEALRAELYNFLLFTNAYPSLVKEVDPGFKWATAVDAGSEHLKTWPETVIIQGDADAAVHQDVSFSFTQHLGEKGNFFLAKDQPHLFEAGNFIEDEEPYMDVVHSAVDQLIRVVEFSSAAGQSSIWK